MLFVDNTAKSRVAPCLGSWASTVCGSGPKFGSSTSTILVHLLQPQEAVREEADCCLLTTFWLELPFFSRIKTRMETALFHRWEN